MVQHAKVLATKPNNLSSSPRIHVVKGETYTQKVSSDVFVHIHIFLCSNFFT